MTSLFEFPNPVNEVAARTVATGVAVLSASIIVLSVALGHAWLWLSVPLALGFLARLLTGPTLSPLGQLATRVVAPRLGREKLVPGPPKRFAQGMGTTLSAGAVLAHVYGLDTLALVLLAMIVVAATLESVLALCLGCHAFALLMRIGVIPEETCVACADISLRTAQSAPAPTSSR